MVWCNRRVKVEVGFEVTKVLRVMELRPRELVKATMGSLRAEAVKDVAIGDEQIREVMM